MAEASRVCLISDPLSGPGAASVPLDVIGQVTNARYTTQYPGGDTTLNCDFLFDPRAVPDALRLGRNLRAVLAGAVVWAGRYDTPTAGQPWQISATGIGGLTEAIITATGGTSDATIDATIAAGEIPWVARDGHFPDAPQPTDQQLWTFGAWLNNIGLVGTKWSVSPAGIISPRTDPTTPDYLLASTTTVGRTAQDYWNRIQGLYIDSTSLVRGFTAVQNNDGIGTHGLRTAPVDLTDFGPMTATQAQAYLQQLLNRSGYRTSFVAPFTAQQGQLLTYPGGQVVDNATVRAGCMVRIINLDPDQGGEIAAGPVDIVIGETDYSIDDGDIELHPVEITREDLQQLLTDLKQAA